MNKRNTIQKELVLKAVNMLGNHATADEIYASVNEFFPSISKGTVYRDLNALSEEGRILKIQIPGGADRFDHRCDRHFHAVCIKCKKVFDMDSGLKEKIDNLITEENLNFLGYDIIFRCICPECSANR